jgi:hypothetical protein
MSIKPFVRDGLEVRETARIGETGGRYLIEIVKRRLERERDTIETAPRFDNENPLNDLRFRLGYVAALRWVLGVPGECSKLLNRMDDN